MKDFFCSELSRGVAEKTFGTASSGHVWLLLEYPVAWGAKALESSALSTKVKSHLTRVVKTIPRARLLLIKQARGCQGDLNFFVVRSRERDPFAVNFQIENYEQLTEIDVAQAAAGKIPAGGTLTQEPMFLVCTHGRRDKCCAKFGYPLYKSLRTNVGSAVWQSSHVGGDRFAANLICFPHGLFYAHVTEDAGRKIIGEYTEQRMVLEKYRGRACYSNAVQAAEFFIRSKSGIAGVEDLRFLDNVRLDENSWRVRFETVEDGEIHETRISSRVSEFQNFITCHATERGSVPQFLLDDYRVTNERVLVKA
ncbi:MAG TPA: sucrase ferredoxin [Pyrinomonadaceae bacterium]|nr:sucrase ferredoxin [Pyrinomonadaceae bacterium]